MGYHMCGYNYVYFYGYFLYMLHVYVYCYFSVNMCIYIMYFPVYVLYIKLPQEFCVCIYFNCIQFKKFMWHSSVRCWVCYSMFHRENVRVLWHSVSRHGWSRMLQYGIRASIFKTKPGWVEKVELKRNVTEDLF
jgi:hypothetical protein